MSQRIDWKTLNAYVDGELSPAAMAQVAEALTRDPELARQMADLRRLKSAIFKGRPGTCPPIRLQPPRPRWRMRIAAAFLFLALAGGLAPALFEAERGYRLQQAMAAHAAWSDQDPAMVRDRPAILLKSSLLQLRLDAYIPDLSPAGLRYDGIRRIGDGGLHVGYRGTHGCRVSLVVFPGTRKLSTRLSSFTAGDGRAYGWQVRGNTFYLLAPQMDPQRLHRMAEVVHRMTRAYTPMDRETSLVLNEARQQARPCSV